MNFNDIARIVRPIAQKIDRVITRGVVTKVNNDGVNEFNPGSGDSPQLVSIKGMPGDIYTEIPRYQSYGHESYPAKDAEAVLLAPSGESENSFIIVIQDISLRPTDLAETEVTDYGPLDDAGATIPTYQRVHFKADGSVEIRAGKNNLIKFTKDGKLELTVDDDFDLNITGNANITASGNVVIAASEIQANCDNVVTGADVKADGISLKTHFHQGNLGFPTGAPIQAGGGTTPTDLPTADADGRITDGPGTNLSTHTHTQPNDGGGDAESPTSAPV